jgi:hypothetical protein
MLLLLFVVMLVACRNSNTDSLLTGNALMVIIRAEVVEIISNHALKVEVTEPAHVYDNGENLLLPGVFATVIFGEDIYWINDAIDNEVIDD